MRGGYFSSWFSGGILTQHARAIATGEGARRDPNERYAARAPRQALRGRRQGASERASEGASERGRAVVAVVTRSERREGGERAVRGGRRELSARRRPASQPKCRDERTRSLFRRSSLLSYSRLATRARALSSSPRDRAARHASPTHATRRPAAPSSCATPTVAFRIVFASSLLLRARR